MLQPLSEQVQGFAPAATCELPRKMLVQARKQVETQVRMKVFAALLVMRLGPPLLLSVQLHPRVARWAEQLKVMEQEQ
jgi:hypothetical protein